MSDPELHILELADVAQLIQARKLSSAEVTKAQLDRIALHDPHLHSFAAVLPDQAMRAARAADQDLASGLIRGPLHGVPLAVKDLCWTDDAPATHGMPIHRDFRPAEDGTVARKLREAGAVILGKLTQTEGALGDYHPDNTAPLNPWNADYTPGASSSGSGVATAAGLCYGAIGSDTGGSIRLPAAANGCTGLKPSWGRVSRHGCFGMGPSLDHIGTLTRSAADAALMLGAIAGADPKDPTASLEPVPNYRAGLTRGIRRLRLGVDRRWNAGVDAATAQMMGEALAVMADLGADIREITFPDAEHCIADWLDLCAIESAVTHEATYPARAAEYGPALRAFLEQGRGKSAMDYQKIVVRRLDFCGQVRAALDPIDLLVIPVSTMASLHLAQLDRIDDSPDLLPGLLRYNCPFNMTGNPTITLPSGFTEAGTPIAFQLVAGPFREDLLLRAGWAYQQATDWHHQHPNL